MLSRLLPMVEGIDPDAYVAPDLSASTEIPQLDANSATAPAFELKNVFAQEDAQPAQDAPAAPEPAPAPAQDLAGSIDFSKQDDLIARMTSILKDEAPAAPKQESLFDETRAPGMPVYHPYEPAQQTPEQPEPVAVPQEQAPVFEAAAEAPADDFEEFETDDVFAEPAEPDDDAEDEDEDDLPREPFKFRLTKNFDIFDDDND